MKTEADLIGTESRHLFEGWQVGRQAQTGALSSACLSTDVMSGETWCLGSYSSGNFTATLASPLFG